MAACYQHNLHYSPSRVGQKSGSLNRGRHIGEVLIKKVGNIVIIMIVGLPFRWLEKEDKSSSYIVMRNIKAFFWKLKKGITVTSVDGRLRSLCILFVVVIVYGETRI